MKKILEETPTMIDKEMREKYMCELGKIAYIEKEPQNRLDIKKITHKD